MSKSGKEIVAEAAKRAAELIDEGSTSRTKPILIANQFAPFAELYHKALTIHRIIGKDTKTYPDGTLGRIFLNELAEAIAEVEKMGGG